MSHNAQAFKFSCEFFLLHPNKLFKWRYNLVVYRLDAHIGQPQQTHDFTENGQLQKFKQTINDLKWAQLYVCVMMFYMKKLASLDEREEGIHFIFRWAGWLTGAIIAQETTPGYLFRQFVLLLIC